MSEPLQPLSKEDFDKTPLREYMLLISNPAAGKSHTILSTIYMARRLNPTIKGYIIDTENGILKIWKKKFPDLVPGVDVDYYAVKDVDEFLEAFDQVRAKVNPGDWLCCESLARFWEYCQDYAMQVIAGMTKPAYLEKRLLAGGEGKRLGSPIPQPDQFWQFSKHHYSRCFLDILQTLPCNIILSTSASSEKPPGMESAARKEVFKSLGVSADGWPKSPYYPDTLVVLTCERDGYYATISKDRGYDNPGIVVKFKVNNFLMDYQASKGGL